jgi:hypothetical protein
MLGLDQATPASLACISEDMASNLTYFELTTLLGK